MKKLPERDPSALKQRRLRGADARFLGFFILAVADLASIWAGCLIAFELAERQHDVTAGFTAIALTYLAVGALAGSFSRRALLSLGFSIAASLKAATFSIVAVWGVACLRGEWVAAELGGVALAAGLVTVLMLAGRVCLAVLSNLVAATFSTDLLIIDDVEPRKVPPNYRTILAGTLGVSSEGAIGAVGYFRLRALAGKADRVLVSCSIHRYQLWEEILDALALDAAVIVPELRQESAFNRDFETELPILRVSRGPLSLRQRIHKRMFDIGLAVILFVALTPIFAIIWIALALSSGKRKVTRTRTVLGIRNEPFRTTWFDVGRTTWWGRALNCSGLVKAPMLLDVILGRMSIVGPAPVAATDPIQAKRLRNLKPGLFKPVTLNLGSSYREGWTVWRDIASFACLKTWPID